MFRQVATTIGVEVLDIKHSNVHISIWQQRNVSQQSALMESNCTCIGVRNYRLQGTPDTRREMAVLLLDKHQAVEALGVAQRVVESDDGGCGGRGGSDVLPIGWSE